MTYLYLFTASIRDLYQAVRVVVGVGVSLGLESSTFLPFLLSIPFIILTLTFLSPS